MGTDNIWGLKVNQFWKKKKKEGTMESEIGTEVSLKKTILRLEL